VNKIKLLPIWVFSILFLFPIFPATAQQVAPQEIEANPYVSIRLTTLKFLLDNQKDQNAVEPIRDYLKGAEVRQREPIRDWNPLIIPDVQTMYLPGSIPLRTR
jgi:hypothetical protein